MRRPMRQRTLGVLITLAIAMLLAAASAVPGLATPAAGFVSTALGRGTDQSVGTLVLQAGTDTVISKNVVEVGGSSGWHSHPGGAIVVVQEGQITTYRSVGNHCDVTTYTTGQSFLERPSDTLNAVNTGSIQTIIFAAFPGVPAGGSPRIDRPDPGTC
jgi:quercetin dioxygenase-like cupin family protein